MSTVIVNPTNNPIVQQFEQVLAQMGEQALLTLSNQALVWFMQWATSAMASVQPHPQAVARASNKAGLAVGLVANSASSAKSTLGTITETGAEHSITIG